MLEELSNFAVLRSLQDWTTYKSEISKTVIGDDIVGSENAMHFPPPPKRYPCLAASLVVILDPTQDNKIAQYQVNCCYVYTEDAENLLAANEEMTTSPVFPQAVAEAALALHEEQTESAEDNTFFRQVCTVLASLVVELEAIGAVKKQKLFEEIAKTDKFAKQKAPSDFLQFLQELLEPRNAG